MLNKTPDMQNAVQNVLLYTKFMNNHNFPGKFQMGLKKKKKSECLWQNIGLSGVKIRQYYRPFHKTKPRTVESPTFSLQKKAQNRSGQCLGLQERGEVCGPWEEHPRHWPLPSPTLPHRRLWANERLWQVSKWTWSSLRVRKSSRALKWPPTTPVLTSIGEKEWLLPLHFLPLPLATFAGRCSAVLPDSRETLPLAQDVQ